MMKVDLDRVRLQVRTGAQELLKQAKLSAGDVFVLGISTSTIAGAKMSGAPSAEIGATVVNELCDLLEPLGVHLAVEGCVEINRALTVERKVAEERHLQIVTVYPSIHARGAAQIAAFERFADPVEVAHITAEAGMDIGGCEIGMHIRFVQVPVKTIIDHVGAAYTTFLSSRPPLVGGARAKYTWDQFA